MTFANHTPDPRDALLLERVHDAIAHWKSICDGVTSSITGGGAIQQFEQEFSARLDGRLVLAMPSGTAALRVALEAVGVVAGSEVICPVYDWPAAVAAIRSLGARPIFADVDPHTLTMAPDDAAKRLSRRTRGVVVTHLFGVPADVPRLVALMNPRGVPVIEDCAQALGATIDGQPVGTLGAAASFSFGPGKAVDAGEGGLVAFGRSVDYTAALCSSQHPVRQLIAGVTELRPDGLALRMHPLAAMLALEALTSLSQHLAERREHAYAVHRLLDPCADIELIGIDVRRQPSWYRVPFLAARADFTEFPSLSVARAGATLLGPCRAAVRIAAEVAPRAFVGELIPPVAPA